MLNLENLTFSYTNDPILSEVNAVIGSNQKVGLIGVNGAGKSTLLKIITGSLIPESGQVKLPPKYGYISQELNKDLDDNKFKTILDFVNQERKFEAYEVAILLNKIGMSDKLPESEFYSLSGGQKTKVAIIKLLLEQPDLLILDEPTNFLDINSANWLMNYLCDFKGAILVVSHDLRLMNRAIDKIWFLNEFTHKIEQYKGNYDHFLMIKEEEDKSLVRKMKKEARDYQRLLRIAKNLAKNTKTELKSKSAKYREQAKEFKENMTKRQNKSRKIRIKIDIKKTPGYKIVSVKNVSRSFDTDTGNKQVLVDINFELKRRDRLVVIGKNGVGKTTLLKIVSQRLEAENGPEGKAEIEFGYNVDIGYYSQEYENIDQSLSAIDLVPERDKGRFRSFLGNFLFTRDKVFQQISSLSGGEKTRLALAKMFFEGHNFLLLDEPTTFLDPASQEVLIEFLSQFNETFILVSHHPELVQEVNPTHALLLPEENFAIYEESMLDRVTVY
ncbi:ABC-F family ATP-binding cassette domain-containing protein [Candidatus Dojkabacteria bacterium]|nr:ABC-F family ATP-binding cassette domain-containing protein [Candidatus Dojkabacteria bacterium]